MSFQQFIKFAAKERIFIYIQSQEVGVPFMKDQYTLLDSYSEAELRTMIKNNQFTLRFVAKPSSPANTDHFIIPPFLCGAYRVEVYSFYDKPIGFIEQFTNLKELRINSCSISILYSHTFENLNKLELHFYGSYFHKLELCIPKLKVLQLGAYYSDEDINEEDSYWFTKIEKIDISDLQNLEIIKLEYQDLNSDTPISIISNRELPTLKEIFLGEFCETFDEHQIDILNHEYRLIRAD